MSEPKFKIGDTVLVAGYEPGVSGMEMYVGHVKRIASIVTCVDNSKWYGYELEGTDRYWREERLIPAEIYVSDGIRDPIDKLL